MFIKEKNYDKAIQKVRIEVGTIVGCEKDDEAFILLKELPTQSMMKLRENLGKGEAEFMDYMKEVLPNIIVDHNFYVTEQKKMSNSELADLIFEKLELTTKVLEEYTNLSFRLSKQGTAKRDSESSN